MTLPCSSAASPNAARRAAPSLPWRLKARLSLLPLLLAAAMLPATVSAQPVAPSAEPTLEDRETARKLYRLGHERYRAGDYHGALESFQSADRIMGVPTTGLELGRTQAQLGLLVEARDRLLQVTRYPERPDEPKPFTQARADAAELAEQLAQRIPAVRAEVLGPDGPLTDDPTVRVKIDGREVPPELRSVPRSVNPGSHILEASATGFAPQRETIKLSEGDQRVVQLVLAEAEAEPSAVSGGADDEGSLVEPLMWTAFGIGGAGLVVGGITGALTLSAGASLDEDCPDKQCPPDKQDDIDDASTLGDVSTGSFIVGGVGVGAGLVLLIVALSQEDAADRSEDGSAATEGVAQLHLQPLIAPGWVGLTGRF